jgi:Pyridine nucleotide-disulphide oxidoreductase
LASCANQKRIAKTSSLSEAGERQSSAEAQTNFHLLLESAFPGNAVCRRPDRPDVFADVWRCSGECRLIECFFIIGGGYVDCEFAAICRAFGCQVTLAEKSERLLPSWDENVGAHIAQQLTAVGVELMLDWNIPVYDLPKEEGWPIQVVSGPEKSRD